MIDDNFTGDLLLLDSKYYLLLFIILLSTIDISSYLSGKIFGSLKIAPNISPNKTMEGYLGGYISTVVIFMIFSELSGNLWEFLDFLYLTI